MPKDKPAFHEPDNPFWDAIASDWDESVYDTLADDEKGVIRNELRRAANGAASVADFGCGVGKYLEFLARRFDQVHGFDRSQACVNLARERFQTFSNVEVNNTRVCGKYRGRFDVVICMNVALQPGRKNRLKILGSAVSLMKRRGTLLLLVPSLESAALLAEAEGRSSPGVPVPVSEVGVVALGGTLTKHYGREELTALLTRLPLSVSRVRKVEYSWNSNGVSPPGRMRHMRPWDWLAVCHKR